MNLWTRAWRRYGSASPVTAAGLWLPRHDLFQLPFSCKRWYQVLQEGGNAFDAALAVAAVETVTIVPVCGLGGDSFVLLHEAQTGKITGVNSSGVAASGATSAYYRTQGYRTMPLDGPHAVSVPGEVAAWEVIHQQFCTKPFAQLLDGAIGYAENGFPLPPGIGRSFASNAGNWRSSRPPPLSCCAVVRRRRKAMCW